MRLYSISLLWWWCMPRGMNGFSSWNGGMTMQSYPSSSNTRIWSTKSRSSTSSSSSSSSSSCSNTMDENELMKQDIEDLKLEALRRIEELNSKFDFATGTTISETTPSVDEEKPQQPPTTNNNNENDPLPTATKQLTQRRDDELLDGTFWKVALDIGREPGTWMPKTWGLSGERLLLNLDMEFLSVPLMDQEEFLGARRGGNKNHHKVLRVKQNQLTLSPTLTEGTKKIAVKNGGWTISRGGGPLGTDLLRFYVEVEEEVRHCGGDVYCPAGRIYCTCGYFPMTMPDSGAKERYRKKLQQAVNKVETMSDQREAEGWLSMNRYKLSRDIFNLKVEAQRLNERYNACRVMEPDIDLLKLSKDQSVGLTREGGVCCKVSKGVAVEYHILGRFSIVSTNPPNQL
jgi:hypothetical protein